MSEDDRPEIGPNSLTELRQAMLDGNTTPWCMLYTRSDRDREAALREDWARSDDPVEMICVFVEDSPLADAAKIAWGFFGYNEGCTCTVYRNKPCPVCCNEIRAAVECPTWDEMLAAHARTSG